MKRVNLILIISVFALASCSYKLTSVKYSSKLTPKKNDLYYVLNKTVLEVNLTYNKKVVTKYENGIPKIENPIYTVKQVEIKPTQIADKNELYIARGKNISHKFFLKENIDFTFNSNGSIKSVTADFVDESPESFESLISTVASIAKTVMVAGSDEVEFVSKLKGDITKAYAKLNSAILKNDAKQTTIYQKELDDLYKLLESFNEKNKSVIANSEIKFTLLVDPDDYEWSSEGTKEIELSPETALVATDLPPIKMILSNDIKSDSTNKNVVFGETFKTKDTDYKIPGLMYRIPSNNKIQIVASYSDIEVKLTEQLVKFPQYGNYGYVPVTSKIFTNRKTELTFDETNGNLTKYKTESGSSSNQMSKSMKASATTLLEAINYINYDLELKDLEHKKKVKEFEESLKVDETSKIDSLKSEFELLKLQKEFEEYGKTETTELEKLKEELEILKLKLEIEKLKKE